MSDREVLLYVGALYLVAVIVAARTGVVGALEGCIHRAECPTGFWIILVAHGTAGIGMAGIAATL